MGVDVGISIKIFQNDSNNYKEIGVSGQTNSLGSLFYNPEIQYTSIKFDMEAELTEEEFELFRLQADDDDDMMMVSFSKIIDIDLAIRTFNKIYIKIYSIKDHALNNDLKEIDLLDISLEEKDKRKESQISQYLDFENSFGVLVGILSTAKLFGNRIQIVAECY